MVVLLCCGHMRSGGCARQFMLLAGRELRAVCAVCIETLSLVSLSKSWEKRTQRIERTMGRIWKRLWGLLKSIEDRRGSDTVRVSNCIRGYFNDLFAFLECDGGDSANNKVKMALRQFIVNRRVSQQCRAEESSMATRSSSSPS